MLMKLYMHDFVDPKTTKNKICDSLEEVSYEDNKFMKIINEETEKRKALPDTTAIQKQGHVLSKQQEIGRKQTYQYKKKDAKW